MFKMQVDKQLTQDIYKVENLELSATNKSIKGICFGHPKLPKQERRAKTAHFFLPALAASPALV